MVGAQPLSKSVIRDARSNVMLLSWKARPARLAELLGSLRMRQLMAYLRTSCDLVLVDAPPIDTAEGRAVISYADAVLFVAGTSGAAQAAAVRGLTQLQALRAPTVGIALAG